jgi:hypothetical protein
MSSCKLLPEASMGLFLLMGSSNRTLEDEGDSESSVPTLLKGSGVFLRGADQRHGLNLLLQLSLLT